MRNNMQHFGGYEKFNNSETLFSLYRTQQCVSSRGRAGPVPAVDVIYAQCSL